VNVVLWDREDVRAAGALVARALGQSPDIVLRLRETRSPTGEPRLQLGAWLPYDVLVMRSIELRSPAQGTDRADLAVFGRDLLDGLERVGSDGVLDLARMPPAWWSGTWPSAPCWRPREVVAAEVVHGLAREAARALKGTEPAGRSATQQAGALMLDQTVLTATDSGGDVRVPLRLLLASSRMGFLGSHPARVATATGWIRLDATYGSSVVRDGADLSLRPV
jgi:hypothetical protein